MKLFTTLAGLCIVIIQFRMLYSSFGQCELSEMCFANKAYMHILTNSVVFHIDTHPVLNISLCLYLHRASVLSCVSYCDSGDSIFSSYDHDTVYEYVDGMAIKIDSALQMI